MSQYNAFIKSENLKTSPNLKAYKTLWQQELGTKANTNGTKPRLISGS